MPFLSNLCSGVREGVKSVPLVGDLHHAVADGGDAVLVGEDAFVTQGDAHRGGHAREAAVAVVLEGEDVAVRRGAEEHLVEGGALVDHLVEDMVGLDARLALHHKEGVGLDEDHVELVVVVRPGARDAHAEGYLLRTHLPQDEVEDILLEPSAREVVDLLGQEHVGLLADEAELVQQGADARDGLSTAPPAAVYLVEGHGAAHAAVVEAEQVDGLEGLLAEVAAAEAVEDALCLGFCAAGLVAAGGDVVPQAMQGEIFGQRHAVADGGDDIVVVVDAVVEDRADHEVLARLDVEEPGSEAGKDALHGQHGVTRAAGEVDPIVLIAGERPAEAAADMLVDVGLGAALEGDGADVGVRQPQQGGVGRHGGALVVGRDKEDAVALLVILLEEEVGGQRLGRVEYIDKGLHRSTSMKPWRMVWMVTPWALKT